jgi:hypothetical protein
MRQDLDHPTGPVQVDSAMPEPVAGCMDHAIGTVERRLEPGSGSEINTSTPACRNRCGATSLEPADDLDAEQSRASGDHNPHRVRIVVRIVRAWLRRSRWLSPVEGFSDGGITSNFPVHFFDNALPRWPTVSLNLGIHPDDAPHQDVWLPQDWDDLNIPVKTLGGSGLGFG